MLFANERFSDANALFELSIILSFIAALVEPKVMFPASCSFLTKFRNYGFRQVIVVLFQRSIVTRMPLMVMLMGFDWLKVKVREPARRLPLSPAGPALLQQRQKEA